MVAAQEVYVWIHSAKRQYGRWNESMECLAGVGNFEAMPVCGWVQVLVAEK